MTQLFAFSNRSLSKLNNPSILADVAPITRWDYDVLQQEGANRLKDVVSKIKELCQV